MAVYVLNRRLCLNAARDKAVEPDDPEAACVLGGPGHEIPHEEARRLGLLDPPEAKAVSEPPADKAIHAAQAENKGGVDYPRQARRLGR
jgi:hypothetical protein